MNPGAMRTFAELAFTCHLKKKNVFQVVKFFPEVWFEIFKPCWEAPKIILEFLIYDSMAMIFSRRRN